MDLDYSDTDRAKELAARAEEFMDEVVIPAERNLGPMEDPSSELIEELRQEAKNRDIYCPQIDEEWGGMGYEFQDVLPLFEQAGRSLLGHTAMRVNAPDEGNMHTIESVGTQEQKERWLRPLVEGEISSAFSMTEPHSRGGADPKMLKTTARRDGDEWVINGHKWWTSGGSQADILIVMCRTDLDAHPYGGCSMILVEPDRDGVNIVRDIPTLGAEESYGHAEVIYDDVRVPAENLLGDENEGFQIAQLRLGPARLTHCMRYSGMAQRSLEIAKAYMNEREGFGDKIAEKQGPRFMIAECETKLHSARCMVRHAARQITAGSQARIEVAMCKTYTANVVQEVVDTCLQLCGGNGIARDLPLADFYESMRPFRIVDGPDEVHKRSIARAAFREINPEEIQNITRFEAQTALTEEPAPV